MRNPKETKLIFPTEQPAQLKAETVVARFVKSTGKTENVTLGRICSIVDDPEEVRSKIVAGRNDAINHKKAGVYDPSRYADNLEIPKLGGVNLAGAIVQQAAYRWYK